jgi:hypothetical protein
VSLWHKLRQEFAHAFALTPTGAPLSNAELALLQKIAMLIKRRGMTTPALLFLESLGPLNFLGSQVVHGLKPFLDVVCDPAELERLALLLERRDGIDLLISLLQDQMISSNVDL